MENYYSNYPGMGMMGMYCHDPLMGSQFELAKAYVRIQCYQCQFSPEMALRLGTLFPELYRPYPPKKMNNDECCC